MPDFRNLSNSTKPYVILTYQAADGTSTEVSESTPLPTGGSGGAGALETPLQVYAHQFLTVSTVELSLTVPAEANRGRVIVLTNTAAMGLLSSAQTPTYTVNEGEFLFGAQLAAWRLIRSGATDATVRADFWRV